MKLISVVIVLLACVLSVTRAFIKSSSRFISKTQPTSSSSSTTFLQADLVDTAEENGSFKILASALKAANLVDTLKGPGPFTVLAPSDDAFAKLPAGTLEALLQDIPKLSSILTYHVISGAVKAETVMTLDGKQAKTVNGADVTIKIVDGSVKIDGANVVSTDIICDNGVIHVIDSVLLPALAQPKEKRDEDMTKAEIEAKYNTGRKLYKPREAKWFPSLLAPASLDGSMAGDVGFDPLGFSLDKEGAPKGSRLKFMRNAELKHARLAMLASLGWPASELYHKELADTFGLESILASNDKAPSVMNGGLLNGWVEATGVFTVILAGVLEFLQMQRDKDNQSPPGDIGFDPLGLYTFRSSFNLYVVGQELSREQKLKDAKLDMELCEIKNGRLAMIGITGMAFQELVAGTPVIEQTPIFFGDPIF